MVKRYWKKRKWKPGKVDSIWDNPNTKQEEKIEKSNKWATEIKKTLRGSGAFTRIDKVRQFVGQRFSEKKGNHTEADSRLLRSADTSSYLSSFYTAKLYTESPSW
jgi:hypothetical protein